MKILEEKRAELMSEMEKLINTAKTENRAFTDDEDCRFAQLEQEAAGINGVIRAECKLAELRYNPYHDPTNGRFTTADGGGTGAFLHVPMGSKGKGEYVFSTDTYKFEKQNLPTGVHGNTLAISEKINGIEISTKIELKQLTGTEKQIKYAEDIRTKLLTDNANMMLDTFYRKTQSKEQQEKFSQMLKNNGFKSASDYVNQGFASMNKNILAISSAAEIIDTSKRKNDIYWR